MALGFVVDSSRFSTFFSNLFNDLKSSRRFQVATVLWVPFWIATIILLVRFGVRNQMAEKFHEWSMTIIPEKNIQYPDVELVFENAPTSIVCQTFETPQTPVSTNLACTDNRPWTQYGRTCRLLQLSTVTAHENAANTFFGNPIQCVLQFPAKPNSNLDMMLYTPNSFNSSSPWNVEANFLRPNLETSVHLTHQYFFGMNHEAANAWSAEVHSLSSLYADGTVPYNATIWFRVPFGAVNVFFEHTGFDQWMMLAFWGGGIYFFYFLHMIIFNGLKFILPADSRLLRADARSAEYTPLK